MALFRERDKKIFPLRNIPCVLQLFKLQLEKNDEPNLSLLSIVIGAIENSLTCNRTTPISQQQQTSSTENKLDSAAATAAAVEATIPTLDLRTVEALYQKFQSQIKGSVDLTQYKTSGYATRDLVKRVSDVIWSSLTRSYYKDRAHLQSLYSYLTGKSNVCVCV